MSHSFMRKCPIGPNPACMKAGHVRWVTRCVLTLVVVLMPLLFGHSFGSDIWQVPTGQPEQMRSQVHYDPELMDTFFESDALDYSDCSRVAKSGTTPEGEGSPEKDTTTARCFSTGFGVKHLVEFCEAKLVDVNSIDLLIHYTGSEFLDRLRVQVRSGMFTCQYWTSYLGPIRNGDLIWTTKRQELILDKNVYQKGDVIKGRIDFECLQEITNPLFVEHWGRWPRTIKVHGVFKTIVE